MELVKNYHPFLILIDLNQPGTHGGVILKDLITDKNTMEIPVIVLSGDPMPAEVKNLIKVGAKDSISKPLDIEKFLDMIDRYNN